MLRRDNFKYYLLLLLFSIMGCVEEPAGPIRHEPNPNYEEAPHDVTIAFDHVPCLHDQETGTFLYPISQDTISEYSPFIRFPFNTLTLEINGIKIKNNSVNNLGDVEINKTYDVVLYYEDDTLHTCQLIFTLLPVIHLSVEEDIVDEPKKLCTFSLSNPYNGSTVRRYVSLAGIEIRGGISQTFPKKSFGIELWGDQYGNEKEKESLMQLRSDDDWIMDAMYIDRARMRNRICWDIWRLLDKPGNREGSSHIGIDGWFVELFINDSYHGLYSLNERIDAKQCSRMGIDLSESQGVIYKAESWTDEVFLRGYKDTATGLQWQGWEQKYPDQKHWQPLYQLISFVNSSDEEFEEKIQDYIDLDNFIDFYIFINLTKGLDNCAKNTFLVRSDDQSPFVVVPWDLDATLGRDWDSTISSHDEIISNDLYRKLIATDVNRFCKRLNDRWGELKEDRFTLNTLQGMIREYADLFTRSGVIDRENRRWGSGLDIDTEAGYMINWLQHRITFLDSCFAEY